MLTPEVLRKLDELERRFEELTALLSDPAVVSSGDRYRKVAKERAGLEATVLALRAYRKLVQDLADNEALLADKDPGLRDMAKEELAALRPLLAPAEEQLKMFLVPKDPNDEKDVILEIRAGAGGDEAGLFAAELLRMYLRYAERRGWRCEVADTSPGSLGGVKEAVVTITGDAVYSSLKYESGVHRVQRVPATEAQGRIHTSTVTVAVMPEAEDIDIQVNPADIEMDVFRSTGSGGQSVNTTDSAVRITHLPTGLVVEIQDEKSQHKNKAKALSVLRSRLYDLELAKQREAQSAERRLMVGGGERSEKIRTYNFPDNRVTDHRIGTTIHNVPGVLEGQLDPLIDALVMADQADRLRNLTESDDGPDSGAPGRS
jgi:peptide chain release factor 1